MSKVLLFLVIAVMAVGWSCGELDELSLCAGTDSSLSSVRVADESEPGEPMVVTGRVLVGRHQAPVAGARILLYHTNAAGKYARDGSGYPGAYLCGVLRTDKEGRYRIETIRPAPRNGRRGAHIHFDVTAPWGDRYFDSVSFAGDPLLGFMPAGERWDYIRPVDRGDDGVQYVEKDIWFRN